MKGHPLSNYIKNLTKPDVKFWDVLKPEPAFILIEITNRCNYRCVICPLKDSSYPKLDMDSALFRKIIDDIAQWNPNRRLLHIRVFGEPFLHPQIFEFMEYVEGKLPNCEIVFGTNFTAVNEEIIERFFKPKLRNVNFGIWIDAVSPEVYSRQRGNGYFNVMRNLEYLIELKRKYGTVNPKFHIGMVITRNNMKEVKTFKEFWANKLEGLKGVEIKTADSHDWAGQVSEGGVLIKKSRLFNYRTVCRFPFREMNIFSNGDVSLCCRDVNHKMAVGNVRNETLRAIWLGDKAGAFRERIKSFDLDSFKPCKDCNNYSESVIKAMWRKTSRLIRGALDTGEEH